MTYSVEIKASNQVDYTVQSASDYYPYGKALRSYGRERYQSTYHERDVESGFDYRGARFYDGDIVRFNSLDPLAMEFPSWSDYNYVLGNPVILIDPDGRAAEQADCCGNGTPPTVGGVLFEAFQNARAGLFNTQVRWFESLIGNHNSTSVRMRVNYNRDGSITVGNPTRIVQEPKKGILAETGDALLDVLALTPAVELGSARNVGAMSGPFLAAKTPGSIIPSVTKQFKNGQCMDCTDAVVDVLKKEGISGEILNIVTPKTTGMQANIWSDVADDLISTNGRHRAVLVEGKVYDNIHQEGIDYKNWVNDIHAPGGYEIQTTNF